MINTQKLQEKYEGLKVKRKLVNESLNTLTEAYKMCLNEEDAGVTGTLSADIANTENSVNDILLSYYMERYLPSIPRDALNIVKMKGWTNILFTVRAKNDDTGIEICKSRLNVFNNSPMRTSITVEALHDIFAVHGLDGIKIVANYLRDRANREENTNFIHFLRNESFEKPSITLSEPLNMEQVHFEVSKKVQEYIFEMNMQHQRTFEAFAIVPYVQGGAITGIDYLNSVIGGQPNRVDITPIISTYRSVREILTDYYINPDITDPYVYVGLRSRLNPTCSAGIFGAYQEMIKSAVAYETGEQKFFLVNRYGIALNPAHTQQDPMVIKFKIENWLSDVEQGETCVCQCSGSGSGSGDTYRLTEEEISSVLNP